MHILSPIPAARLPVELQSRTACLMAEAASRFLAALTPAQRSRSCFPVESEERQVWDYRPHGRRGVAWRELDSGQGKLAHALVATGLSHPGYLKAAAIMSLEAVLRHLTGRQMYDPDLYYLSIFGTPGDHEPWGWRLDGHHLSLNFLLVEGRYVAATPNFFGANPARVLEGDLSGLRVLASEEDLARGLLKSLPSTQQQKAILAAEAPADIITGNAPRVQMDAPEGLAHAEIAEAQQRLMEDLVVEYTSRMPWDVAEAQLHRIDREGWGHLHFAWAGSPEPGRPHYYRLHGPSFLVEYDNTQNQANHIHTVWRDLRGDWGDDLLADHYRRAH
jgi:hypothetical protein